MSAILVNAAWRGMRVLFASKNNKAVDVVFNRVNGLAPRLTLLRLGTPALQEQLAQHLSATLSSRPTEDDRLAYQESVAKLKRLGEVLADANRACEELVQLRNRVDRLEQAAEPARRLLGESAFGKASPILASDLPRQASILREAISRANPKEASFIDRLVADGLVVTLVVVMIDEGIDLSLEIAGQIVVLEQDAVLQRLVPAFDLALGLGMEGSATDMLDAAVLEPFRQIAGDVGGAVVAQQTWPMGDLGALAA